MRSHGRAAPRRLKKLLAIAGLAVIAGGAVGCGRASQAERPAPRVPAVTVVRAERRDVPITAVPSGTTRALGQVTIQARVRGFLKEMHFREGANVCEGQLLLVIDEEPFRVRVEQAKAVLDAARAGLRRRQASKAREIAQAQVALDETQHQLDRVEERRERNLLARKAASQDDFDRAKAQAEKSLAQVQASRARLEQAIADYEIDILAAQAEVEKAEADLKEAEIELGYCRMFAPINGRAGELKVKLGNLVGPSAGSSEFTNLLTIQQLDPMGIEIRPSSRYLPQITRLIPAGFEVRVFVQGEKLHPYPGKVTFLDNQIDPTTSTVLMRAEVPNPEETLLPGEYVRADLDVGVYAGAIVVPEQAVVEAQEGSRVLVVDEQNRVQPAIVNAIDRHEGLVVIERGLEAGQRVVVEGIQLARPGQTVQPEEAELETFRREHSLPRLGDRLDSPLVRLKGDDQPSPAAAPPAVTPSPAATTPIEPQKTAEPRPTAVPDSPEPP